MTICSITGYACDCQPDEGIPCDGIRKLRDACESWKKQSIERGQQIEAAKHDIERLTAACSAEATEVEQLRTKLLQLADKWEGSTAVAYNDYSYGRRSAFEEAARELLELLEIVGPAEHPTGNGS